MMPSPLGASGPIPRWLTCQRTANDMDPKWTGRWGALAIKSPFGAKRAHE